MYVPMPLIDNILAVARGVARAYVHDRDYLTNNFLKS